MPANSRWDLIRRLRVNQVSEKRQVWFQACKCTVLIIITMRFLFQVVQISTVQPCGLDEKYQRYGETCCLHLIYTKYRVIQKSPCKQSNCIFFSKVLRCLCLKKSENKSFSWLNNHGSHIEHVLHIRRPSSLRTESFESPPHARRLLNRLVYSR